MPKIHTDLKWPKITIAVLTLSFFTVLMNRAGINGFYLSLLLLMFLVQLLVGLIVTKKLDNIIGLGAIKIILSAILGLNLFGFLVFIFGHKVLFNLIFIKKFEIVCYLVIFIYIIVIIINIKYLIKLTASFTELKLNNTIYKLSLVVFIALILSIYIVNNYSYAPANTFGWVNDSDTHLLEIPGQIIQNNGFPVTRSDHNGLQSQLTVYAFILGLGKLQVINFIKAQNFYGTISLIIFILLLYYFCRNIYKINSSISIIASIAAIFFTAINWPPFYLIEHESGKFITSYLGFFSGSPSIYHNLTQQYSIVLVLASFYLISHFLNHNNKENINLILFASIFAVLSFMIKQSGFIFLGPVIFIISIYLVFKDKNPRYLIPAAILLIPIFYQLFYSKLFHLDTIQIVPQISFFRFYFYYIFRKFGYLDNKYLLALIIIIITSFLGFVLPWIFSKNKLDKNINYLNNSIFIFAFLFSTMLVEAGPTMTHGNFTWTFSAFLILYIPYVFKLALDINNKVLKIISFIIIFMHVYSGVLHLIAISLRGIPL